MSRNCSISNLFNDSMMCLCTADRKKSKIECKCDICTYEIDYEKSDQYKNIALYVFLPWIYDQLKVTGQKNLYGIIVNTNSITLVIHLHYAQHNPNSIIFNELVNKDYDIDKIASHLVTMIRQEKLIRPQTQEEYRFIGRSPLFHKLKR
jgi:hypothetical protein